MSYIMGKAKGAKEEVKILVQDKNIFSFNISAIDKSHIHIYDSKYKLEDDEWFKIEKFSKQKHATGLVKNDFSSADFGEIDKDDFYKLEFLLEYNQDKKIYLFQKMLPSRYIKRRFLAFKGIGESQVHIDDQKLIILSDTPDAIYHKADDELYFKNLSKIKAMFPHIDELYREATQEEVEKFAKNGMVSFTEGFTPNDVKPTNRKRIAQFMDENYKYTDADKASLREYAKEYTLDLKNKDGVFIIKNEDDLKKVLNIFGERYYTTKLQNEKRMANSVKKVEEAKT